MVPQRQDAALEHRTGLGITDAGPWPEEFRGRSRGISGSDDKKCLALINAAQGDFGALALCAFCGDSMPLLLRPWASFWADLYHFIQLSVFGPPVHVHSVPEGHGMCCSHDSLVTLRFCSGETPMSHSTLIYGQMESKQPIEIVNRAHTMVVAYCSTFDCITLHVTLGKTLCPGVAQGMLCRR